MSAGDPGERRIGVDLGGTKIEAVVLGAAGHVERRERVPTPAADGYEAIVSAIAALVRQIEEGFGTLSVGIGTPGTISGKTGALKNSNTTVLNGRRLHEDLAGALARPVRIANDANCLALSEATDGAGAGASVVFAVILGTGVGGGWCVDGKLYAGLQGVAGEWGHNPLEPETGPQCYCGRRGCVETFLSGPGFARDYAGAESLSSEQIMARAAVGEPLAVQAFDRYVSRLGRALASVVNIIDPDVVVLGGGMSKVRAIYPRMSEALRPHVFSDEVRTPIVPARHGDSSGVRGAAWLWPRDAAG
ncbi:MAG: ROK family protein [Myxococcota bacterium]